MDGSGIYLGDGAGAVSDGQGARSSDNVWLAAHLEGSRSRAVSDISVDNASGRDHISAGGTSAGATIASGSTGGSVVTGTGTAVASGGVGGSSGGTCGLDGGNGSKANNESLVGEHFRWSFWDLLIDAKRS